MDTKIKEPQLYRTARGTWTYKFQRAGRTFRSECKEKDAALSRLHEDMAIAQSLEERLPTEPPQPPTTARDVRERLINKAVMLKATNGVKLRVSRKGHGNPTFNLPEIETKLVCGERFALLVCQYLGWTQFFDIQGANLHPVPANADWGAIEADLTARIDEILARSSMEVPAAILDALKAIPEGYRLTVGKDGTPRLKRMRG